MGDAERAAWLPDAEYLPFRSEGERTAHGAALRDRVPLGSHAEWHPPVNRADPIEVLERQSTLREPTLVPIRNGRMAQSAFAFYRGGAAIMAADLSGTPSSGLRAQLCGDAHLLNFGLFETPERTLIFGLNDFDETLPGPIEWDVKRLAVSVEIAGRDLGFDDGQREAAVVATVRAYREAMLAFAVQRNLDVWHARLPATELQARLHGLSEKESHREVKRRITQALKRDHLRAFTRLVEEEGGKLRFSNRPPLLVPVEELLDLDQRERYVEVIQSFLRQYRESLPSDRRMLIEQYRYLHMARKVVGVGSVGTRAWVVLLVGHGVDDPMILQLKEAQQSVLAPYAGETEFACQGRRVVEGQRIMQAASDPLLGWYHIRGFDGGDHDFYVRQLWDGKASIDVSQLGPAGLVAYGESCGWTLARGHARSGDRVAMAAYLGDDATFEHAVAEFSRSYADTNEADHGLLCAAIDSGRVAAELGV
jgi:uncharacterized protein (DUF2252 family)